MKYKIHWPTKPIVSYYFLTHSRGFYCAEYSKVLSIFFFLILLFAFVILIIAEEESVLNLLQLKDLRPQIFIRPFIIQFIKLINSFFNNM